MFHTREELANTLTADIGGSQGANSTAGVREREGANRTREAGDSVLVKTERSGEEVANALSAFIGLIASLIAAPVLLLAAHRSGNTGFFAGVLVFAVTMIALYLASALYHAWPQTRGKQTLQMLDHCAIFLLIAGTYTPFALGPLRGVCGSTILGYVWVFAIFGVILKATRGPLRYRGFSLFLYLAMGWSALILIRPVISNLPPAALFWLLAGGVAYTAGVLFFLNDRMRYAHFIWHLFVITGTGCHYLAILTCTAYGS